MKIIHFTYSLQQGGAERLIVDLSNEFSKNHEVYICTLFDDANPLFTFYKDQLDPRVNYINLAASPEKKIRDIYLVTKVLLKVKPDVVHTHLGLIYYCMLPALFFRRIKFFHTLHSDAILEIGNTKLRPIKHFLFRRKIFRPITISHESRRSYGQFYHLNNSHLIYNGRKLPEKTGAFELVHEEIQSLKIHNDDLVFLHVGRFNPPKNQKLLIEVFNRLLNEGHHMILLILGIEYDLPEAEELVKSVEKGVYFLNEKKNVADYYLNSDAFCLSSSIEGLPITILEALACGCIPISTPVGGITDIIQDGINGFLSKDLTPEAYYEAIKRFIAHKEEIVKENLIRCFKENYSIEKCAEEHYIAYTDH